MQINALISRGFRSSAYALVRACNAIRYILRLDFAGLFSRINQVRKEGFVQASRSGEVIALLYIPHTYSVALAFEEVLSDLSCKTMLTEHYDQRIKADLWFVFGAQVIRKLPPRGRRVIVQLEQTSSSRWFTRRYKKDLIQSVAVADFSQQNLAGLEKFGICYPHVYLTRIAPLRRAPVISQQRDIEVLFYGDPKNPRREKFLSRLRQMFQVTVISNLFGDEMFALIARARCVVNIHYYDDSSLETTRINECVSVNTPVISETAKDVGEYPGIDEMVTFVPIGDIEGMVRAVQSCLSHSSFDDVRECRFIEHRRRQLSSDLLRLMRGINVSVAADRLLMTDDLQGKPCVLTLPETTARYQRAQSEFGRSFQLIHGLRASPGWQGCGLSYKALARQAIAQDFKQLWVFEDDVELPHDFDDFVLSVERFLDERGGDWDVFCGLIAVMDDSVRVTEVHNFNGITFVVLTDMISMVANAYSRRALTFLANWDESLLCANTNTIDKYLNTKVSRVVTTFPMKFGHVESVHSSIWGFSNTAYRHLINESNQRLEKLVEDFASGSQIS